MILVVATEMSGCMYVMWLGKQKRELERRRVKEVEVEMGG